MLESRLLLVSLLGAVCLAAAGCAPEPEVGEADVARAQEALQPFKQELLEALVGALGEGPENAIAVCRERAPEIAVAVAPEGVRMGRTSFKVRNPANAPEPWMEPLLEHYLDNPQEMAPRAVRLEGGLLGYVEPIHVRAQCLSCHGPSIEPGLLARIRELYPEDRATGFRVDDFRGLFWVTLPASDGA